MRNIAGIIPNPKPIIGSRHSVNIRIFARSLLLKDVFIVSGLGGDEILKSYGLTLSGMVPCVLRKIKITKME